MKLVKNTFFVFCISLPGLSMAQESLFSIQDLTYQGASRIPVFTYGDSRMGFANGTFLVDSDRNSIFAIGHAQHKAIAEFSLQGFSTSPSLVDLPRMKNVQPFTTVLDKVPSGNDENLDHITGLKKINGSIWVNAVQYYDGNADNSDTSFIIEDPTNLESSPISGFYKLGAKVKAAGWVTEIPDSLKSILGGDYVFGYASNVPINARHSMGPSAYVVDDNDLVGLNPGEVIPMEELLSFSIDNQLHPDHYNKNLENDIWTEVSTAYTGFMVPGTDTYAVFGASGGHESGIGYKITQDDGHQCGGACPYIASDIYNYYWLWDINDLVKVKEGTIKPYEVRPYEYGRLELPFENQAQFSKPRLMIAAYYDYQGQSVYFMLGNADPLQNQYETAPVLLKYSIEIGRRPSAPSGISVE